jgi:hypothetical protein
MKNTLSSPAIPVPSSASTDAAVALFGAAILCIVMAYASRNARSAPAGYTFVCFVMGTALLATSVLIYYVGA